jgi:hypothetical protein
MKRLATVLCATAAVLVGLLAFGAVPAYAYPTSPFGGTRSFGSTEGTFTWYNRSVRVNGSVSDYLSPGYTKVAFEFFHNDVYLNRQTRSVTSGNEPFDFVEPGPVGGITVIDVYLCNGASACEIVFIGFRPD